MLGSLHAEMQRERSSNDGQVLDLVSYNNSYKKNGNDKCIYDEQSFILGNHSYISPKASAEDRENKIYRVKLKGSARCGDNDAECANPLDGFESVIHNQSF
jgi:hypothetical protein